MFLTELVTVAVYFYLYNLDKGPVIIYHLGERGGGGSEDFGLNTMISCRSPPPLNVILLK